MSVQLLTYLFVGLTFAIYIGIAIWSKAQSTNDFYVAGKGVHPVATGMATAADWMSAASFLSMAGLIAFLGKDGSVYLMGAKAHQVYSLMVKRGNNFSKSLSGIHMKKDTVLFIF